MLKLTIHSTLLRTHLNGALRDPIISHTHKYKILFFNNNKPFMMYTFIDKIIYNIGKCDRHKYFPITNTCKIIKYGNTIICTHEGKRKLLSFLFK